MAFKNKEDQAKYHREVWYPRNKARRMELNKAWQDKQRDWYQSYKETLSCAVCKESCTACLDFHHTDPTMKEFSIGAGMTQNKSIAQLQKEIEKCVVLCSNCHRKYHAGVIQLAE